MSSYKAPKRILFIFVYAIFLISAVELLLRIIVFVNTNWNSHDKLYDSGAYTIVCIGDSFTYGWGVDTLDTYPKQLERLLNGSKIMIKGFKVFNLGIPGSNSSQHLKLIEELVTSHNKPNLIILLTGANDAWNLSDSNLYEFVKKDKPYDYLGLKAKTFLANLKIYNMLKVISLNMHRLPKESGFDPFKIIPKHEGIDTVSLEKLFEHNLSRIVKVCRDNQVGLIVQNYPRGDLYEDELTEKLCSSNKAIFVDTYGNFNNALKNVEFRDLFLYDNSHPSQKGYEIMAGGLSRKIVSMLKHN